MPPPPPPNTHRGPLGCLRSPPWPHADPREQCGARPGAQYMNISVLAKLPSADVIAPAAVATRRIPLRDEEETRASGPRCLRELCPVGLPSVPERGTQTGVDSASLLPAPCPWRNGEALPGPASPRHSLGEPAPSVGFKRPLSAPRIADRQAGLGSSSPWGCLAALPSNSCLCPPHSCAPICALSFRPAQNDPKCTQMRNPVLEETFEAP